MPNTVKSSTSVTKAARTSLPASSAWQNELYKKSIGLVVLQVWNQIEKM